jgi:hypothetical protein
MPPVLLMELLFVLLELQMEMVLLSIFWLSPPLQTHFRTPL